MMNQKIVDEWMQFAEMDYKTAIYLFETMYPKPFEIICYHCQQAVEKLLKGTLIGEGQQIQRTHDLGILAEQLKAWKAIPDYVLDICDNLTPYGVKIRYPQELYIEEHHVSKAIEDMKKVFDWMKMEL
jgi:HEPN domain-containing protein